MHEARVNMMPWTWEQEPRIVSYARTREGERNDDGNQTTRIEGQARRLRTDRVALLAQRIGMQRAGARVQVREIDVQLALAGEDTIYTRCMAWSLREIHEEELQTWIAHGLITNEELRRCEALNPRKKMEDGKR